MTRWLAIIVACCALQTQAGEAKPMVDTRSTITIKASKNDPLYDFKQTINTYGALMSQFNVGGGNSTCVYEPLSLFERNQLRKIKTNFLTLQGGANQYLLEDGTLFRDLQVVSLGSEAYNSTYLKALTLNYPNVPTVCIRQVLPLSDESVTYLKSLRGTQGFELCCPIQTPNLLTNAYQHHLSICKSMDDVSCLSYHVYANIASIIAESMRSS